jgi:tetratricopeptide (TPR) repeat protein
VGEGEQEKGRKSQAGQDRNDKKERSTSMQNPNNDRDGSGDRRADERGRSVQSPSLIRTLLIPGLVALACGAAGAWGYWHVFGPAKSGDQKSASKDSDSNADSDSSKPDSDQGEVRQADSALKNALKERDQALAAAESARRSEGESKAILDFFKKNLLSAGRSADVSLTEAFWAGAGGKGKDVTLRKAVDAAESQVADAFADRPMAEASVREMLGLAYLSLGEPARAVNQYERALALRETLQGADHPETAECRNQLAVAYRLAGRTAEAGRLFGRNPNSPTYAAALAVRGSMLLFQNNPAEAELKLRESLTIRQKIQPDDWTTFDTMSILGEALSDQKKFAEAEPVLLSGYEGLKQHQDTIPSQDHPRLTKALERLVKLYEAWGKPDKAMKWRQELAATKKS